VFSGGLADDALDLDVVAVADQKDRVFLAGVDLGLVVHAGDERAGRIDHPELAILSFLNDGWRDAVRREDQPGVLRHVSQLVDEDRTLCAQILDDNGVVDDLVAHVDGGAEAIESTIHDLDRALDTGAESSGAG
jgi:hypothetical protein